MTNNLKTYDNCFGRPFTLAKDTLAKGDKDEHFQGRAFYDLAFAIIRTIGNTQLNYGEPIVFERQSSNTGNGPIFRTIYTL